MSYLIHAPGLGQSSMEHTAAFGAAVWLAMQAPKVRDLALHQLERLVLQPQSAASFVLLSKPEGSGWKPHAWMSYAHLDATHEKNHVANPAAPLPDSAWHSGDRLWILHLIAPCGYELDTHRQVQALFANRTARTLSPRSFMLGQRVNIWRGANCPAQDAHAYWQQRPILA
jgi:hemolysin-activating ACP:hemolysin acyltransferase